MREIIDALVYRYLHKLAEGPSQAEIGRYGGHAKGEIAMEVGQVLIDMGSDGLESLSKFLHAPNPRIRREADYLVRVIAGEENLDYWRTQHQETWTDVEDIDYQSSEIYDFVLNNTGGLRHAAVAAIGETASQTPDKVDLPLAMSSLNQSLTSETDWSIQRALIDTLSLFPQYEPIYDTFLWLYAVSGLDHRVRSKLLGALAAYPKSQSIELLIKHLLRLETTPDAKLASILLMRHIEAYKNQIDIQAVIDAAQEISAQGYSHEDNSHIWNDVIFALEAIASESALSIAEAMKVKKTYG